MPHSSCSFLFVCSLVCGAAAVAAEVAEPAQRDPRLLHLRSGSFDPRLTDCATSSADEAPPLRPGRPDRYRLVQLSEKITPRTFERLAGVGLEVLDYVPSRALIVRIPPGSGDAGLDTLDGVRWFGPLQPGYKLDPDLLRPTLEPLSIDVGLHAHEDPRPIVAAVEERFRTARITFLKEGIRPRITLEVGAAEARPLIEALASDSAVAWLARAPELALANDQNIWIGQSFDTVNGPAEALEAEPMPYTLSGTVWNRGLHGEGQILAVADTGLEHGSCYFDDPGHPVTVQTVPAPGALALDLDHRKLVAVNAPQPTALLFDDTFRHGTHISATAVGDDIAHAVDGESSAHDQGDGVAPAARLVFEDVSGSQSASCSTGISVTSFENLLLQEYRAGARVSSNSWGSNSVHADATSFEADAGVHDLEDMLVVLAGGNSGTSGPGSILGLAACKNCLTVGAAETWDPVWPHAVPPLHPDNMTAFSSRGPTADGRIKPDVTAPGYRVRSAGLPVTYFPNTEDPSCVMGDPSVCFPGFGGCYRIDPEGACWTNLLNGTSQAAPAVAGLALLARQYFTEGFHPTGVANPMDAHEPTAALLKAMLINSARNMTGRLYNRVVGGPDVDLGQLADAPSNVQGWGRVALDDALYFPGETRRLRVLDLPHAEGLATDQRVSTTFEVTSNAEPLKLTLVWSDVPGTPISSTALVNDLDLVLSAPDGTVYRGNQWTADAPNVVGDRSSLPNAPGRDDVNNVEGTLIPDPLTGVWRAEISAFEVLSGVQGAALVATGAIDDCTDAAPPEAVFAGFANGQAVLSWNAVPGVAGYEILRNETACGQLLAADTVVAVPAFSTNFSDDSVEPNTTYHYTVRGVTENGCRTEESACVTVVTPSAGPPPVPDGTFGSPVRVAAVNAEKTELLLTWDGSSCPAAGYQVIHGMLSAVEELEPAGSACDLGITGSALWNTPVGDLWFLVISNDGASIEGSWGVDSSGAPRRAGIPSGECSLSLRNDFGTCR